MIFLLEADGDAPVDRLRERLDALGDSLVSSAATACGTSTSTSTTSAPSSRPASRPAGRTGSGSPTSPTRTAAPAASGPYAPSSRSSPAAALASLCEQAGATVVAVRPGEPPAGGEIAAAIRRAHAREVVLLPNDTELRHAAGAAAEQARADGVRVALIPTRSAVQGLAALAVHEPTRSFDEDVVAMTAAAGATRYAELTVAEHQSWTMAGVCQAGDVLGLIDGDVAVIGGTLPEAATAVLDRMLASGGELVTLITGPTAPPDLAHLLQSHVRDAHLAVDTVVYYGSEDSRPLVIGVE